MNRIKRLLGRIESAPSAMAIKSGLVMIIPVLLIGSIMLILMYFPINAYQRFITAALGGRLYAFLNYIYDATFGMLSVFLTVSASYCYARQTEQRRMYFAAPVTALICFFILSGVRLGDSNWDALGVKGMFVAILSAVLASKLLMALLAHRRVRARYYTDASDVEFNNAASAILPALLVVVIFALVNALAIALFDVSCIFELFVNAANAVFLPMGRSFLAGLLMVLVSSVLWFFGIHGSNVLESVMATLFTPAISDNIARAAQGLAPTEIFTKQFFDCFVLMGGCGTAICLLLAILLFSRRRSSRRLTRLAAVPMLFNINELMIFGLPVIFNTALLLPFILTPLFSFLTTYLAMRFGLVPLTISEVNWTAPVLISGYIATGSLRGSLLQLFNIAAGVAIYRPFVRAYDRRCEAAARRQLDALVTLRKESEEAVTPLTLTELTDERGSLARSLAEDLRHTIAQDGVRLYYQPQYDNRGVCVGAEALLRWQHPLYGMIYPPLVIQLARESGFLTTLEAAILRQAVADRAELCAAGFSGEIGVNVSAATIQSAPYFELLRELAEDGVLRPGELCLEITEQTALQSSEAVFDRLRQIKQLGYTLAIDDFSMGHTSLTYLQENQFDTVKLDGSLVRGMMTNPRTYDIVKSITELSRQLGFSVIAEFVEEQAQVQLLEQAGCVRYQGYLFSAAVPCRELIDRLRTEARTAANRH